MVKQILNHAEIWQIECFDTNVQCNIFYILKINLMFGKHNLE